MFGSFLDRSLRVLPPNIAAEVSRVEPTGKRLADRMFVADGTHASPLQRHCAIANPEATE